MSWGNLCSQGYQISLSPSVCVCVCMLKKLFSSAFFCTSTHPTSTVCLCVPISTNDTHVKSYTAHAMVLPRYCLNHCARTCCSRRIVTRCCFTNWPIRCKWGGRNVHFLSINLISFHRSRGTVLVMASPAREMDSAGRQWNPEKDVRNVRDFSVKRLPSGGTRGCMPQQTRYAGVSADWERKLCVFEVGLICTVIDHVTVSERAA